MASHTAGSEKELREFWAGFPHDEHGNVIIQDHARDEELPGIVDPKIQAIIDMFSQEHPKLARA